VLIREGLATERTQVGPEHEVAGLDVFLAVVSGSEEAAAAGIRTR